MESTVRQGWRGLAAGIPNRSGLGLVSDFNHPRRFRGAPPRVHGRSGTSPAAAPGPGRPLPPPAADLRGRRCRPARADPEVVPRGAHGKRRCGKVIKKLSKSYKSYQKVIKKLQKLSKSYRKVAPGRCGRNRCGFRVMARAQFAGQGRGGCRPRGSSLAPGLGGRRVAAAGRGGARWLRGTGLWVGLCSAWRGGLAIRSRGSVGGLRGLSVLLWLAELIWSATAGGSLLRKCARWRVYM